jgi:hypothetical protein
MKAIRPFPLGLPLLLALAASTARAGDDPGAAIASALAREIIGPRQAMAEAEAFADSRIPRMPEVKSAEEWTRLAEGYRDDVHKKVIFRGEAAAWRDAKARVEWLETIEGGPGYKIKKLRYEAIPGLWIPALLYEPEQLEGRVPVVLNVNGHDAKGKAADYKQIRCINQAKRGMLALNVEWLGMGQLRGSGFRHGLINAIDLCGTGGIALHYLAMKRGLDILLAHEHADPARVAVTGLSGGGWQTIFISPLDTRVTLTDPVAGYSSFVTRAHHLSDLGDSEQTPSDLATVVDYAHLTAMMAPKPTLLTFNAKDNCCFAAGHALPPLLDAARPVFRLFGKEENLRDHVNEDPGDHNYGLDNRQAFYRMVGDHFYRGDRGYPYEEIPSDEEVKSAEQLQVELPADNLDIQKVAARLGETLPHAPEFPKAREEAESWQRDRRLTLRATVRPNDEPITTERVGGDEKDGIKATYWKLRVGSSWTVPAVELTKAEGEVKSNAILVADKGRKESAARAEALLAEGARVVAIDPFYFGESQVAERGYLYALLIGTVGERPLGVQAGQVMAVAGWAKSRWKDQPVRVVAEGPRTGLIALVAAALGPDTIAEVTLHAPPESLKEVIKSGVEYSERPEVFCFGLLESFDVRQVAALVAPRPVKLVDSSEQSRRDFRGLGDWYTTLGGSSESAPATETAGP